MNVLQDVVRSEYEYTEARQKLLSSEVERVDLIQRGLHNPEQRGSCLRLIEYLSLEEREYLFSDLLELSSVAHADLQLCHQVVLMYPHDWLLEHIEEMAERLLENGSYEEYRCLLELYIRIDNDLTQRLIDRALQQDDLDIIEAGEDFQKLLSSRKTNSDRKLSIPQPARPPELITAARAELQRLSIKPTTKKGRRAKPRLGFIIFSCGTTDHNLL
jgi:hypothetical protein